MKQPLLKFRPLTIQVDQVNGAIVRATSGGPPQTAVHPPEEDRMDLAPSGESFGRKWAEQP